MKYQSLCFRCEHRAKFMESTEWGGKDIVKRGHQPRCECGDFTRAVIGCYMYRPIKPVVMATDKGDKRSPFGPAMISARMHGTELPDMELIVRKYNKGSLAYWAFKR